MPKQQWNDKPYHSFDFYCKETYGSKLYKIALDAGMTCPNRDGTLATGGCIFCSQGGSGDFAVKRTASHDGNTAAVPLTMTEQLQKGQALFCHKKTGNRFIAYFQAYTNTYAPLSYLEKVYTQALDAPAVCGISIATRPDCLGAPVLTLLADLKRRYPQKFIWIELGLQTMHEATARYIRRGYDLPVFEQALSDLAHIGIPVIVHVILGLPGETLEHMLATIHYLNRHLCNRFPMCGIKLQLLHVLRHTDLAADYADGRFAVMELEEYIDTVIACLEHLSPEVVIHRVTGDGPRDLLIAPLWSLHKRNVLNSLHKAMHERQTFQGRYYHESGTTDTL